MKSFIYVVATTIATGVAKLQGIQSLRVYNGVCMLLFCLFTLNSCWVKQSVTVTDKAPQYLGNRYKDMKGSTKQQILLDMGASDRTMADGKGGEILIYENKTLVTQSDAVAVSTTSSRSAAVAGQTYGGNPAVVAGGSSTSVGDYSSLTTTREEKAFVHFFINSNGICYDVKCNVGDRWSAAQTHQGCYKTANKSLLWFLMPPLTLYGIPVSIWYLCNKNKVKPCN